MVEVEPPQPRGPSHPCQQQCPHQGTVPLERGESGELLRGLVSAGEGLLLGHRHPQELAQRRPALANVEH